MDKQKLIDLLNKDLAGELQAIHAYLHQYAVATGLRGHEFREIIGPEIPAELEHAKFLGDKIAALGGDPIVDAAPWKPHREVRDMVAYDLELERQAISDYKERADQAREYGDVGLAVHLENFVADETQHAETMERLLRGFMELERT